MAIIRCVKNTARGPRPVYLDSDTGKEAAHPWPLQVGDYMDVESGPDGKPAEFLITELDFPFGRAALVEDSPRRWRLFYLQWSDDGSAFNFSRRVGAVGFFGPKRWESAEKITHEISLNPSHLRQQSPTEICQTLVHEMVHLEQHEFGSPSRTGYHNHQWADWMERVGLMPSTTGKPGGRRVGQGVVDYPIEGGAFERAVEQLLKEEGSSAPLFPWMCVEEETRGSRGGKSGAPAGGAGEDAGGGDEEAAPAPRNKVKYSCDDCGVNVWGKPELAIVCGLCGQAFTAAD